MKTYTPGLITDPVLRREMESIQQAAQRAEPYIHFQVTNTEPAKKAEGQVFYADGTNWNPLGTGKGWYGWDGAAWIKLG